MKYLPIIFSVLVASNSLAQLDNTPVVVNVNDSPVIQYNGAFVKQKATCYNYTPIINSTKDFSITVQIRCYVNNSGSYGAAIFSDLLTNNNLSTDQQSQFQVVYADRTVMYNTVNQCVDNDTNGNVVPCSTPGSVPEIQYWQKFKLNQLSGIGTLSTQGAADVQYKIIQAIIAKLDSRKKW